MALLLHVQCQFERRVGVFSENGHYFEVTNDNAHSAVSEYEQAYKELDLSCLRASAPLGDKGQKKKKRIFNSKLKLREENPTPSITLCPLQVGFVPALFKVFFNVTFADSADERTPEKSSFQQTYD